MIFITRNATSMILQVPTLNDNKTDYIRLFSLCQKIRSLENQSIIIDFSGCRFLRQNAVAFLGGLARFAQARGCSVSFDWNTLREDIRANLTQNGFFDVFEGTQREWSGNSVPYREYRHEDMDAIVDYLENHWLCSDRVQLSPDNRDEIIQNASELYSNVFEHSASAHGVFTCGQRYQNIGDLCLAVADFGVGIPNKVRQFLNQPQKSAGEALKWALQLGNTTRANKIAGGTGLDTLKNFIKAKQGKIEIYSNDGYALIDSNQELYENSSTSFEGTLINITIRCDQPGLQSDKVGLIF
jgi:hypothetical protein